MCVYTKTVKDGGVHVVVGIYPSLKYYVVVKNICNARRYFEEYLKKFNIALTFCEHIHSLSNLAQSQGE